MLIDEKQCCDNCRVEVNFWPQNGKMNSPMLETSIWKKVLKNYNIKYKEFRGHQFLCDNCVVKALNRPMKYSDLRKCSLTEDWLKENMNNRKLFRDEKTN